MNEPTTICDATSSRSGSTLMQMPGAVHEFLVRLPAVLYECGPAPIFATTFVSDNVYAQYGYAPEEFYEDPFFWIKRIHENDRSRILRDLASIGDRDAIEYEYRFCRSNGEYAWLHDQVSVLRDREGQIVGLVGSWFDISDYKRLQMLQSGQAQILDHLVQRRPLQETLEQIARMVESQNPGVICSILRFDPATQTLRHGAAPSLPEEYNRHVDGLKVGPAAGSCGTAAYRQERVVVTDIRTDPLWVDFRDVAERFHLCACWSQPFLSSSGQLLGTFAMYYCDPRGPSLAEATLIEQAATLAAIAIERYRDEEVMRHTERLASLGTLAAGIAHEINNPLCAIQLAAQGAAAALTRGQTDQVRGLLDGIIRDNERCARIVRGVLQFGKPSATPKQAVTTNQILRAACELTSGHAAKRGATVELVEGPADCEIEGRLVELEQIFVNLIQNGIESKDRGARVQVRTVLDADSVRVFVTDDGRGMNEELKARIFDPFFTTREDEGGTGLGLSIVHGVVAAHGGAISIDSKPQKGTTVVVCLPRAPDCRLSRNAHATDPRRAAFPAAVRTSRPGQRRG